MVIIEGAHMVLHFESLTIKILKISHGIFHKSFPRHCHGKNYYELHYIVSGGGTLVTDEGEFPLSKNLFYMTGPLIYHEQLVDADNPTEEYCIQMEILCGDSSRLQPSSRLLTETHFWIGEDKFDSLSLFELISKECYNKRIGYIQATISLVSMILTNLVRNYSSDTEVDTFEESTPDYRKLNIVESSFFSKFRTITLEDLSKSLKLSPRQTQRFLIQNYSKTFSELKKEARYHKARDLIRSGMSVLDASLAVGYSDTRVIKSMLASDPSFKTEAPDE